MFRKAHTSLYPKPDESSLYPEPSFPRYIFIAFSSHRLLHTHDHLWSGTGTIGQIVADVPVNSVSTHLTPPLEMKYSSTYVWVFLVVFFLLVFAPKSCMHSSSLPYPEHLIHLDMNIVITFDNGYKFWKLKENNSSIELRRVLTICSPILEQFCFYG
jgi:hypothetical protein